ncbi:hypothetical protein AB0M97_21070 [Streptomyces sp. NPDC051207]|uniref:hypothetical protein n=1 Tax=Streptomyces sp. NPDC051207 TaxID=3154641 RepID=UPI00341ED332
MHTYDVPRRQSYQPLPPGRPAREPQGGPSATPIYDALYAEYVRSFRTLPGDRSGEEDLGFTAFGHSPHGTGSWNSPGHGSHGSSYSAYSAGAHSARHTTGQLSPWQRVGQIERQGSGTQHVPAALPPGPRRGL